ncbi:unnamed protein product [Kluyveromyces dobzhanskii CBS 2104]|uniref:WGS project CCBQ000000000 data, contig 00012 n=1 Tax=Kluyveromyces dobzhanskii CBS 2104 TaxID=1427455 RepID=A0A0A8L0M2_9SACH|nr:unnamed protein product [Kluyveromyces dobzhanskii CBS 2104]
MGLLDSVKSYATKQSENGEDLIDKAEGYLGAERVGQIKQKVGEDNYKKFEDQARSYLDGSTASSEKKDSTETQTKTSEKKQEN